jgi:hypothetical protein
MLMKMKKNEMGKKDGKGNGSGEGGGISAPKLKIVHEKMNPPLPGMAFPVRQDVNQDFFGKFLCTTGFC